MISQARVEENSEKLDRAGAMSTVDVDSPAIAFGSRRGERSRPTGRDESRIWGSLVWKREALGEP